MRHRYRYLVEAFTGENRVSMGSTTAENFTEVQDVVARVIDLLTKPGHTIALSVQLTDLPTTPPTGAAEG